MQRDHAVLLLQPFTDRHAAAWLRQFRDPRIAAAAGMPRLASEEDLAAYMAALSVCFGAERAIVHTGLGLIGSLGFHRLGDCACLHFWIATAHQRQGNKERGNACVRIPEICAKGTEGPAQTDLPQTDLLHRDSP